MIILSASRNAAQFLETLQLILAGEQEVTIDGLVCVPDTRIAELVANGAETPADSDEDWFVIQTPDGRSVYVTSAKARVAA